MSITSVDTIIKRFSAEFEPIFGTQYGQKQRDWLRAEIEARDQEIKELLDGIINTLQQTK